MIITMIAINALCLPEVWRFRGYLGRGRGGRKWGRGGRKRGRGEGVEIHNVECRRQALPERAAKLTGRTLSLFGMHGSAPMSYPHPHKSWQEQLAAYHIEAVG